MRTTPVRRTSSTLPSKATQYRNGVFAPQGTLPGCEFTDTGRSIRGIEELGIPTIRMTNSGTGVKGGACANDPGATGLPSTPNMAATFDRDLNYEVGRILGEETRSQAHQVLLAPGMNLIRHPYGGRAFEYFSEDPYLTGAMASPSRSRASRTRESRHRSSTWPVMSRRPSVIQLVPIFPQRP